MKVLTLTQEVVSRVKALNYAADRNRVLVVTPCELETIVREVLTRSDFTRETLAASSETQEERPGLSEVPMQLVRLASQLRDLTPKSRSATIMIVPDPECPHADVVIAIQTTASVDEAVVSDDARIAAVIDDPLSERGLSIVAQVDFVEVDRPSELAEANEELAACRSQVGGMVRAAFEAGCHARPCGDDGWIFDAPSSSQARAAAEAYAAYRAQSSLVPHEAKKDGEQ